MATSDRTPTRVAVVLVEKPVSTSTGFAGPAGRWRNGTKMTLYPLRGCRFHEPCCPDEHPPPVTTGQRRAGEYAMAKGRLCGAPSA
jgi:hypothetical protein